MWVFLCFFCLILKHLEGLSWKKKVWVYSQVIWKLPNNSTKLIQHSGDTYSLRLSRFYNMELSSHLEQRRNVVERQRKQTIRNDWQTGNIKRHLERATKEKQIHILSEQNTKQRIPRNRSDWSMWIMQKYRSATRGASPKSAQHLSPSIHTASLTRGSNDRQFIQHQRMTCPSGHLVLTASQGSSTAPLPARHRWTNNAHAPHSCVRDTYRARNTYRALSWFC